ncbi:PqqD family protein [Sphingobacterium sp. SYP-B4668]|uniref:PqqD family protein n=1 Tax=Sphingobacterium sp. SYP-B4668 TaxID=2996035 RepID=UPI0022DCE536|nr:PqqD family protein [Sphingobacterium sp. SYP-B4668]
MRLRTDLTLRKLGDEYLIVDPGQDMIDMSKVYTLNDTAAQVWQALQGKEFELDTVVEILTSHFEVNKEIATQDASVLVEELDKQGLVCK